MPINPKHTNLLFSIFFAMCCAAFFAIQANAQDKDCEDALLPKPSVVELSDFRNLRNTQLGLHALGSYTIPNALEGTEEHAQIALEHTRKILKLMRDQANSALKATAILSLGRFTANHFGAPMPEFAVQGPLDRQVLTELCWQFTQNPNSKEIQDSSISAIRLILDSSDRFGERRVELISHFFHFRSMPEDVRAAEIKRLLEQNTDSVAHDQLVDAALGIVLDTYETESFRNAAAQALGYLDRFEVERVNMGFSLATHALDQILILNENTARHESLQKLQPLPRLHLRASQATQVLSRLSTLLATPNCPEEYRRVALETLESFVEKFDRTDINERVLKALVTSVIRTTNSSELLIARRDRLFGKLLGRSDDFDNLVIILNSPQISARLKIKAIQQIERLGEVMVLVPHQEGLLRRALSWIARDRNNPQELQILARHLLGLLEKR